MIFNVRNSSNLLKVQTVEIPAKNWGAGGTWLSSPYTIAPVIEGYTPIGIVGARPSSSSALTVSLNLNNSDRSIRGCIRNHTSSAVNNAIWVYLLYVKDEMVGQ